MSHAIVAREVYLRHTSSDGKSYVNEHRVWNAALFIASQQEAVEKVNAAIKGDAPRLAAVQQITKEQYMKERSK